MSKYVVSYINFFEERGIRTKIIELSENSTWKDALYMTFGEVVIGRNCMASELKGEVHGEENWFSDNYDDALNDALKQDCSFTVIEI